MGVINYFLDNRKTKSFLTKRKYPDKDKKFIIAENLLDFTKSHENDNNTYKIFGLGNELFDKIREFSNQGFIHLGLRVKTVNEGILKSLPIIQFNNIEIYTTDDTELYEEKFQFFTGAKKAFSPIKYPEYTICNLKDYDEKLLWQFLDSGDIAFDFESYNLTNQKKFFPLGLSISDFNKAVYFAFPDEYDKISDHPFFSHLKTFIEKVKDRIWAYNCPFEMGVLNRMYDTTYEVQDAFILVMCDGRRGALKLNGQYYLGIKSWDDEIDKIQKYFKDIFKKYDSGEVFLSRFKESKFYTGEYILDSRIEELTGGRVTKKLKKEDMDLQGTSFPDIFNSFILSDQTYWNWEDRIVKYWGNEWAIIPDDIMGYYCCMDSFVTLKLVEKIKPKYTKQCYKVHLNNMYLKYYSDTTGQLKINWFLKNEVENYYKKLEFNSKAYLTLLTYKLHKGYFDDMLGDEVLSSFNIPQGIINDALKYKSYFYFEKDPVKRAKKFIKLIMPKKKEIKINVLNDVVGQENSNLFMWLVDPEKFKDEDYEDISNLLEELLHTQEVIHKIIDYYYESNKRMIEARNEEILKEYWVGKDKTKSSLIEYLKHGVFNNKKLSAKIIEKVILFYVDDPDIKYRLKNNFLPHDYVKNVIIYASLDRRIKGLSKLLADKTIESEIDERMTKYMDYNFTSAKCNLEYGNWEAYFFKDKVLRALTFYDTYLDLCENGFEPGQSEWADFLAMEEYYKDSANKAVLRQCRSYNKFYGKFSLTWRFTNFYKELTDKRFINFCKCFSDKTPTTLKKTDKLLMPDLECNDLYFLDYLDKILRLYKYAVKELTSAIKFINCNSYKIDLVGTNTLVNDTKGTGEGYYSIPKIIPLKTKTGRFAASIHTIGGGDDGKLLMVNDDSDLIASYFDVSQAEVRMLATMSGDPGLLEVFKQNKDPYKEMSIKAFPYLALKENASKLKDIRQSYKGVYLSYLYQAMAKTIAENTGLPISVVNRILTEMDMDYARAVEWAKEMVFYAKVNGFRKTFFGNKSYVEMNENVVTTSVNHPVQEATTKILGDGYCNIIRHALARDLFVRFKYSVHDSCVIVFKIENLFEMVMLYREYFRKYIKATYGVDFKYDLDLFLNNHRDHSSFQYNHETGKFAISGFGYQVDMFLAKLGSYYDFKILKKDESPVKVSDKIFELTSKQPGRDHNCFPIVDYLPNLTKGTTVCQLKEPLHYDFLKQSIYDDNV